MKVVKIASVLAVGLALTVAASGATRAWGVPAAGGAAARGAPAVAEPTLRVLRSDASGAVLELSTPYVSLEERTLAGGPCTSVTVPGYGSSDEAGWPELPVRGAMLGIPPGAEVSLTVLESERVAVPGTYDVCPVPQPVVEHDRAGRISARGLAFERDEAAYATDAPYPPSLAQIVSTGYVRSQRVVQLRLHPLQVNPATGQLHHVRRMLLRVDFIGGVDRPPSRRTFGDVDEGAFEPTLRRTLLNADSARAWRIPPDRTDPQVGAAQGAPGTNGPAYKIAADAEGMYRITRADLAATGSAQVTAAEAAAQTDGPAYKIAVDAEGMYGITRADLAAAGADPDDLDGLDPRSFQLHNQGQEVAIHVVGEGDGAFDAGDEILFYGEGMDTRFTDVNVYWLSWGGADGARMATLDGTPDGTTPVPESFRATHRMEEDNNYQASLPSGPDDDRWYWEFIWATSPTVYTYTRTLQHVASGSGSATVRALFKGYEAWPQHHTRVHLNGHLIDDATWAARAEYSFAADVPARHLIEGTNTITVEVPMDLGISGSFFLVNWFEIDYDRAYAADGDLAFFGGDDAGTWEYRVGGFSTNAVEAFDVTEPTSPTRILNPSVEPDDGGYTLAFQQTIAGDHRYVALSPGRVRSPLGIEKASPTDLHTPSSGADYIIITHGDFYSDVLPLADHRADQGLRTAVVDVQDVYDGFSHGIFDPTAIRDFLAHAYAHWPGPAPSYVVLVGDGHYDFKDNFGYGEPVYIPPYLANVDIWIGETATDNRYVCVSGDDILPDMHIGRLPAKTSAEASAMVSKILAYEQDPPPGDWNEQLLFVADAADQAGDFADFSDWTADEYVPEAYSVQKVYYKVTHATPGAARAAIVAAINEGRLLVNYFGHSTQQFWSPARLFRLGDIDALTNARRLPLMVPMTCLDGYFIHPSPADRDLSSLGESIVRADGRGAIASWSPAGLSVTGGHGMLNRGLFQAVFFDGVGQVGPATTEAKLHLYSSTGGYRDLVDTYTLFGDPALGLGLVEERHGVYLPLVMRGGG